MVTHTEGKEDAPKLRVEDGTKNTACCTSDRVTSAEITSRTITKDIVAVAHSFKWKWGVGRAKGSRQKEKWATKGLMDRNV